MYKHLKDEFQTLNLKITFWFIFQSKPPSGIF